MPAHITSYICARRKVCKKLMVSNCKYPELWNRWYIGGFHNNLNNEVLLVGSREPDTLNQLPAHTYCSRSYWNYSRTMTLIINVWLPITCANMIIMNTHSLCTETHYLGPKLPLFSTTFFQLWTCMWSHLLQSFLLLIWIQPCQTWVDPSAQLYLTCSNPTVLMLLAAIWQIYIFGQWCNKIDSHWFDSFFYLSPT